jgi:rubrerythrin
MSKTEKNLHEAFAGESQANRKYLAFAKKADQEGYPQVGKLFRAAAEAETVHAHTHLRNLNAIKSTEENLKDAIAGESHEFKEMYPQMITDAREEGETKAEHGFLFANQVEKVHADLYQKALDSLGQEVEVDYHVCSVCGYTVENEVPDKCPICGAPAKAFFQVD